MLGVILHRMFKEGLFEELTFEQASGSGKPWGHLGKEYARKWKQLEKRIKLGTLREELPKNNSGTTERKSEPRQWWEGSRVGDRLEQYLFYGPGRRKQWFRR